MGTVVYSKHTNTQCQLYVCVSKLEKGDKQNYQATKTEAKCEIEMAVLDKCYKIAKAPSFDVMSNYGREKEQSCLAFSQCSGSKAGSQDELCSVFLFYYR